jgi:hypothetical protein
VYFFGSLQGRIRDLSFDPELLYIAAMFHDVGLNSEFHDSDRRFEIESADEARRFLHARGVPEDGIRRVFTAIALHTTPGVPPFMEPEVALLTAGVEYDVMGIGYGDIADELRAEITSGLQAQHPEGIHRRDGGQAGHHLRNCERRRPGALHPWLRAHRLRAIIQTSAWPE